MRQVLQSLHMYDTRRNLCNSSQEGDIEDDTRDRSCERPPGREHVDSCSSASVSDTVIGDIEESARFVLESTHRQRHLDTRKESHPIEHKKQTVKTPREKCVGKAQWLPIVSIMGVAGLIASLVFWITTRREEKMYQMRFEGTAAQALEVLELNMAKSKAFLENWSLQISLLYVSGDEPFMTIPNFEVQGQDELANAGARWASFCPVVTAKNRYQWEQYAVRNQAWVVESLQEAGNLDPLVSVSEFIHRTPGPYQNATEPLYQDLYLPLWQTVPIVGNQEAINFDGFNYSFVPKVFDSMTASFESVMYQDTQNDLADFTDPTEVIIVTPIDNTRVPNRAPSNMVGVIMAIVPWERFLVSLAPTNAPSMTLVIESACHLPLSFEIHGKTAVFLGNGDKHDEKRDSEEVSANLNAFQAVQGCESHFSLYPSHQSWKDESSSNLPWAFALCATVLFLFAALTFYANNLSSKRRQEELEEVATVSNAVVRSLFPDAVRSRMIQDPTRIISEGILAENTFKEHSRDGSKPIADLFPHASVCFMDIAGFTAWSSSREPTQVFTLLESLYSSFDKIATRTKVFKVETIGDSYVAATGLPDRMSDHAAVMARFTTLCMKRFREVVVKLEVTLGPDTCELALRAGIHSGAVTAGVLRGEKSRFQLFGDTVNVASRMESTGVKNKIQLSQAAADLIIRDSPELCVKPRDQLVDVKGKGKMQTYWLIFDNGERPTDTQDDHSDVHGKTSTSSFIPGGEKHHRLIDWNVDVLQGLLKKVVAMRSESSIKSTKKLAKLKLELPEGSSVIDEVKETIQIRSKSEYKRNPETIDLGSVVLAQLRDFVTVISQNYRDNYFHSFAHASHVTQSVTKLLGRIVAPEVIDYDNLTYRKKENAVLHYYTYGITSDPLTQFAVAFSALIHDLDHKGVPNATLIAERTAEARKYNDKSVAEQRSVDLAWEILIRPEYADLRACIYNDRKEFQRFRQLVVTSVMATDIVDKQLKALRNKRWEISFPSTTASGCQEDDVMPLQVSSDEMNRKATIVIEHLIQASDVAHTMQHWHVYRKWNQRFFFECFQGYLDGRTSVDPSDGWYEGELGFFDHYIIPLAKKLKECGVFGVSSDEFLQYATSNRAEWEEKGHDLVDQYVAAYKAHIFGGFLSRTPSTRTESICSIDFLVEES